MAPSLAATSVTAIAVDLRWVGKTSTPDQIKVNLHHMYNSRLGLLRQSRLLNPMVETAPKTQEMTR